VTRLLVLAALLTLAVPAAFASPPAGKGKPETSSSSSAGPSSGRGPAALCRAERAKDPDAFAKKYGTNGNLRNAFGKCVSGKTKEQGDEQDQQKTPNAAKQCKKERADLGADAFAAKYGTNANKRNAFGKCVSAKAKAAAKGTSESNGGKDESNEGQDDSGD
jgi:hypothetical protein